jgi:hypothetical protein
MKDYAPEGGLAAAGFADDAKRSALVQRKVDAVDACSQPPPP